MTRDDNASADSQGWMAWRSTLVAVVAALAMALSGGAARAELLRFDLTETDLSIFGGGLWAEYAAPSVGLVRRSHFHLRYETGPDFDAAKILVRVEAPTPGLPVWEVSGESLGWSGQGTFEADVSTEELNGPFIGDDQTVFAFLVIQYGTTDGSTMGGRFTDSALFLDYEPATRLIASPDPVRAGELAIFTATDLRLALPDTKTYLLYSTRGRGLTFAGPLFVHVDLAAPVIAGVAFPDGDGTAQWMLDIPANASGRAVHFQTVQQFHKSNLLVVQVE